MAQVDIPKFVQTLRQYYSGILAEGQRRQDTVLRMSAEDAERLLTAALVQACKELINDGSIRDDPKLSGEPETREALH